jgi:hypothetical protein
MKLVEGITPGYSPSVRDISMDLFVFVDLASAHTSVRCDAFKVSVFATLPIQCSIITTTHLCIGYTMVY